MPTPRGTVDRGDSFLAALRLSVISRDVGSAASEEAAPWQAHDELWMYFESRRDGTYIVATPGTKGTSL